MKMFQKICFLATAMSIIFPVESFALRRISQEQGLEKRTFRRMQTTPRRNIRANRLALQRPTNRAVHRQPNLRMLERKGLPARLSLRPAQQTQRHSATPLNRRAILSSKTRNSRQPSVGTPYNDVNTLRVAPARNGTYVYHINDNGVQKVVHGSNSSTRKMTSKEQLEAKKYWEQFAKNMNKRSQDMKNMRYEKWKH